MTTDAMKRTFTLILAALAAAALFGGLVYGVLVAAHVSEPAATTVYGLTPRRFWATAAAGLALVSVVVGALAVRMARAGTGPNRRENPARVPRLRSVIRVSPSPAGSQV